VGVFSEAAATSACASLAGAFVLGCAFLGSATFSTILAGRARFRQGRHSPSAATQIDANRPSEESIQQAWNEDVDVEIVL
jgi:hypothetical protein